MQSNSNNPDGSDDIVEKTGSTLSSVSIPQISFTQKLTNIFGSVASVPMGKLIFGSILVIGIVATFLTFAKGSTVCVLSDCKSTVAAPVTGSEFWAFAGGTATLLILTTFMGFPLLPAVGIATGIWFFMSTTIH